MACQFLETLQECTSMFSDIRHKSHARCSNIKDFPKLKVSSTVLYTF